MKKQMNLIKKNKGGKCSQILHSPYCILKVNWNFYFKSPIKFYRAKIIDYNHACNLIFEYLKGFYNIVRIYSYWNHLSSNIYESNYKIVS